jgi:hypothetical protein
MPATVMSNALRAAITGMVEVGIKRKGGRRLYLMRSKPCLRTALIVNGMSMRIARDASNIIVRNHGVARSSSATNDARTATRTVGAISKRALAGFVLADVYAVGRVSRASKIRTRLRTVATGP